VSAATHREGDDRELEFEGVLERIVFHNRENGFTVAILNGKAGLVTVLGSFPAVQVGDSLRVRGHWTSHPKYGKRLEVGSYQPIVPTTAEAIEKYLSSGLVRGIGAVMAKRIVACFGEKTFSVLEDEPYLLRAVPGIGAKRSEELRRSFLEQRDIRRIVLYLQEHGVATTHAVRIYRTYRNEALEILRTDPYRLARDINGIGFRTADRIALRLGLALDAPSRIAAGLEFVVGEAAAEGHTALPSDEAVERALQLLEVEPGQVRDQLDRSAREERLVLDAGTGVYLPRLYRAEQGLVEEFERLHGAALAVPPPSRPLREVLGFVPTEEQLRAVSTALRSPVTVITGGPGTGKTTIVATLLAEANARELRVELASPTGKAAKRLQEATSRQARTVHRLLEFSPREGGFKRDREHPLEADLVVVDESSMLDVVLAHRLFCAIPTGARLVLVGDVDQLPSVGPGNVLADLIASRRCAVVALSTIFRQAEQSSIVVNAHRINAGNLPRQPEGDGLNDFYLVQCEDPSACLPLMTSLVTERIPARFGLDPLEEVQVLSPMNRGPAGTLELNKRFQEHFTAGRPEVRRGDQVLRVGDKVMQLTNDYDKEVFNGDTGRVETIDLAEQEVFVRLDQRLVRYEFTELDDLALAYAVTVHRFQGSQVPAVVVLLLTQHYPMLQRNLLYTALTRASRLAVILGSKRAIAMAVRNDQVRRRHGYLLERLRSGA